MNGEKASPPEKLRLRSSAAAVGGGRSPAAAVDGGERGEMGGNKKWEFVSHGKTNMSTMILLTMEKTIHRGDCNSTI